MSDLKKSWLPVRVFAKISIRRAFRDKTAMFFIFLFPLIFLFVFGGIFGKNNDTSFKVALINQSDNQYAQKFTQEINSNKLYKVSADSTLSAAENRMSRGQLDAAIVLPANFGETTSSGPAGKATVYYTQNTTQASQALASILQGQFNTVNHQLVGTATPFTVATQQLNVKALSTFDYTFAGLLGFSIIGLGIFGPVNYFPELKKTGVLRRLHTTPLKVWQFFMANVASQTVIGLSSVAIMFVVAIAVFHLKVVGNWVEMVIFISLSIALILGIGLAIGGWAKNERQAAPLSNLVVFPMLFLSGTFFPRFLMPQWLQTVSNFLPLTPVIDGIRLIVTEGKHLTQLGPQLGLMAIWFVIIYAIAFRSFRWE